MRDLSHIVATRTDIVGVYGTSVLLICVFLLGCRTHAALHQDAEFDRLYSATSDAARSQPARSAISKRWSMGIQEEWQFDVASSDTGCMNRIRAKLPEYTVIEQTERKLVLSRQSEGDAVTVVVQAEPSRTAKANHIDVRVVAAPY